MTKREILTDLLAGRLKPEQAKVLIRGIFFRAIEKEGQPGVFDVEIRRGMDWLEYKEMTLDEIEQFKISCSHWVIISTSPNSEWIHSENRDRYPYSEKIHKVTINID